MVSTLSPQYAAASCMRFFAESSLQDLSLSIVCWSTTGVPGPFGVSTSPTIPAGPLPAFVVANGVSPPTNAFAAVGNGERCCTGTGEYPRGDRVLCGPGAAETAVDAFPGREGPPLFPARGAAPEAAGRTGLACFGGITRLLDVNERHLSESTTRLRNSRRIHGKFLSRSTRRVSSNLRHVFRNGKRLPRSQLGRSIKR